MAACWDWAFGFPSFPSLSHFFKRWGVAKLLGKISKANLGRDLTHCQNRSSFDWSENFSYNFVLVPKDRWASTYLVQQITHGSWQHWLILRDVEVILSKSEGFWCTWMCSKPFRHYRQLLNKSFFQIAYHPRRYPDFCSSRSQVLLWPENEHEIEVFITEQLCWYLHSE